MFTELLPLLRQRVVMITVSDVGEGVLRVNVIPRKLDGDSDQKQALTTPLSITGSAEELDRELPGQLATFTESVVKTGSNLEELRIQHAAAVKAVEAENKKHLDEKKKGSGAKATVPLLRPARLRSSRTGSRSSGARRRPPAECRSLFDAQTETAEADRLSVPAEGAPSTC